MKEFSVQFHRHEEPWSVFVPPPGAHLTRPAAATFARQLAREGAAARVLLNGCIVALYPPLAAQQAQRALSTLTKE